jgi:uncharacterized protein YndB with AHSA1/START domain
MGAKRTEGSPVVVERVFNTPVDHLWRAITDAGEMKKWYFDIKDFKAKKGAKFDFTVEHKGFKYVHLCEVKEVIVHKKLAYSWRYQGHAGDSLVTFEIFPEGHLTRLRLTHSGLETFPPVSNFARKNFEFGWNSLVNDKLKKYFLDWEKRKKL